MTYFIDKNGASPCNALYSFLTVQTDKLPLDRKIILASNISSLLKINHISEQDFCNAADRRLRFDDAGLMTAIMRTVQQLRGKGKVHQVKSKSIGKFVAPSVEFTTQVDDAAQFFRQNIGDRLLIKHYKNKYYSVCDCAAVMFYLIYSLVTNSMPKQDCIRYTKKMLTIFRTLYFKNGCYPSSFKANLSRSNEIECSFDVAIIYISVHILEQLLDEIELRNIFFEVKSSVNLLKFFDENKFMFSLALSGRCHIGGYYDKMLSKGYLLHKITGIPFYGVCRDSDSDLSLNVVSCFSNRSFFVPTCDSILGKGLTLLHYVRSEICSLTGFNYDTFFSAKVDEHREYICPYQVVQTAINIDYIITKNALLLFDGRGGYALYSGGKIVLPAVVSPLACRDVAVMKSSNQLIILRGTAAQKMVIKLTLSKLLEMEIVPPKGSYAQCYLPQKNMKIEGEYSRHNMYAADKILGNNNCDYNTCILCEKSITLYISLNTLLNLPLVSNLRPNIIMLASFALRKKLPAHCRVVTNYVQKKTCLRLMSAFGLDGEIRKISRRKNSRSLLEKYLVASADLNFDCDQVNLLPYAEVAQIIGPPQELLPVSKPYKTIKFSSSYEAKFNSANFMRGSFSQKFGNSELRFSEFEIDDLTVKINTDSKQYSPMLCDGGDFEFFMEKQQLRYTGNFVGVRCVLSVNSSTGKMIVAIYNQSIKKLEGKLIVRYNDEAICAERIVLPPQRSTERLVMQCEKVIAQDVMTVCGVPHSNLFCFAAINYFGNSEALNIINRAAYIYLMITICPRLARQQIEQQLVCGGGSTQNYINAALALRYVSASGDTAFLNHNINGCTVSEIALESINSPSKNTSGGMLKYIALVEAMGVGGLVGNRSYVATYMLRLKNHIEQGKMTTLKSIIHCLYFSSNKYLHNIINAITLPPEIKATAFAAAKEHDMQRQMIPKIAAAPICLRGNYQSARLLMLLYRETLYNFGVRRQGGQLSFCPNGFHSSGKLHIKTDINISFKITASGGEKYSYYQIDKRNRKTVINT